MSGLAEIVQTLVPLPSPGENLVLVCKLDASGTDDANAVVCMAGYLAFLEKWTEFELAARPLFDRYGVSLLRAKEFYDTKGDFSGWSRTKKETFIHEIQHGCILGRLDLGVVFGVPKGTWIEAKRKHGLAHNESAFGFCFRAILDQILKDSIIAEVIRLSGDTLSFVLESGDENAEDAHRIFREARKQNPWLARVLYSFGYADKRSAIGLQIADFLAVTSRKYIARYSDKEGYAPETAIVKTLREGISILDVTAVSFFPDERRKREQSS